MKRMLLLVSAVTAPVLVAGCSDGDESAANTRPSASRAPGSPSPSVPAGQRLAGGKVVVTVPAGWKRVDPTTDTSDVVAAAFGLKDNPLGEVGKELLVKLKQKGAVWALDPSTGPERATNLTAACDTGGMLGSSLESLRKQAGGLHKGAKITDTTVSGRPALRIAYTETATLTGVTSETIEVRVPVSDDEYCYAQLNGKPGAVGPVADRILGSFALS